MGSEIVEKLSGRKWKEVQHTHEKKYEAHE